MSQQDLMKKSKDYAETKVKSWLLQLNPTVKEELIKAYEAGYRRGAKDQKETMKTIITGPKPEEIRIVRPDLPLEY